MKIYEFNVVLKDTTQVTDDQADALFHAGCQDGTPASSNGTAWVHFDRKAVSLEEAFRSAIGQIQAAGFATAKIEIDADAVALP